MTLNPSTRRDGPFVGTGDTVFAFTFPVPTGGESDVTVIKFDTVLKVFTLLADPADYTVSILNSNITLAVGLTADENVTILGRATIQQISDILQGELTASEAVEAALDIGVKFQQESIELGGRALVVDEQESGDVYKDGSLPVGVRFIGSAALVTGETVTMVVKATDPLVIEWTSA